MIYNILKIIQTILFNLNYRLNRFVLKYIGVKIGKNLKTFPITTIENPTEISIGDNVWISKNVALYACNGIKIGNDVIIAKDVSLISGDHEYSSKTIKINKQGMQANKPPIIIGDDVWIGEKAIILKSVNIGKGCVVGAGSVVTKDIPPFSVVVGNPAVIIKQRSL